jgi:hypothetical protein
MAKIYKKNGCRKYLDLIIDISYLTMISNTEISISGSSYIFTYNIFAQNYTLYDYTLLLWCHSIVDIRKTASFICSRTVNYIVVWIIKVFVYYNVDFNNSAVSMSFFFFFIRPDTFDHVSRVHRRAVYYIFLYTTLTCRRPQIPIKSLPPHSMSSVFIILYTLLSAQGRRQRRVYTQGLYYIAGIYIIVYADIRHGHVCRRKMLHYTLGKKL